VKTSLEVQNGQKPEENMLGERLHCCLLKIKGDSGNDSEGKNCGETVDLLREY
jgi:hypothetical protein